MTRRFRPPLWTSLLTGLGVAFFAGLGMWQIDRGQAKARWLAQFGQDDAAALSLSAQTSAPPPLTLQRVRARGQWWAERQLLQDGQSRDGRPGYHVWTPLRLADGALVLVNRGWIPQPLDAPLAVAAAEAEVEGWWRALPEPGIRTNAGECREPERFPAAVLYPRHERLVCLLGAGVLPGLLLLDPRAPDGFVREWSFAALPPERHYGYAVTWFALGATAVILFVLLNLKRQ